ncbi:hypothetical protein Leryth_013271 [Lithospermum erythrorhizon]|nr:hypothetical protein Leryth_013271 [Lithospermum erythrorhizon]
MVFGLSLVSIYESYLRYCCSSAGLSSQTIQLDDETTMHFWGPKLGPNHVSKPSLILLHGFGPSGIWQWRHQATFFASYYNVFVPDLVFFGQSTTKSKERSEVFQALCIAKMMEKIGVNKYDVVGTSYGGFVAYRMGNLWGERVGKVVIASSVVNMTKGDNEGLIKRAQGVENIEELLLPSTSEQMRTLLGLSVFKQRSYTPDFLLKDIIDTLYRENRREKMELLKGLTIGHNDIPTVTPLPQEVLIVWGESDQIFQLEKATELQKLLGEHAKLEIMKDTSHLPQIENAGQFNNIVKGFLCPNQ